MTAHDGSCIAPDTASAKSRTQFSGPNLYIVGAPKCGTTAWATHLSSHPDVFVPGAKEPHYFNTDQPSLRWSKTQWECLDHYNNYDGEKIVADALVQYLYSAEAARNTAQFDPRAIILIFPHRLSAFICFYHNQLLMNLDESEEDLRLAWEASGHRSAGDIPAGNREPSMLDYKRVGLISEQIARYLEVFDRAQIMVVFIDVWTRDPRAFYLRLIDCLGVEDDGRTNLPQVHPANHVSSRALHRLTQSAPYLLKMAARLFRLVPGIGRLKATHLLRQMNPRQSYRSTSANAALARAIDDYFAQDQKRLQKLLGTRL